MPIYGTAILCGCLLAGLLLGELLGIPVGRLIGKSTNVGGVGIAMLLLIVICDRLQRSGQMKPPTEKGIAFWGSVYIPIVVAMAASQDVITAVKAGLLAIVAGVVVVAVSFAMVPLLNQIGSKLDEEIIANTVKNSEATDTHKSPTSVPDKSTTDGRS